MKKRITLKQIAKELNYSISTVSKAFILLFKQKLKSSGPGLGAQWTTPVPCSDFTNQDTSIGIT